MHPGYSDIWNANFIYWCFAVTLLNHMLEFLRISCWYFALTGSSFSNSPFRILPFVFLVWHQWCYIHIFTHPCTMSCAMKKSVGKVAWDAIVFFSSLVFFCSSVDCLHTYLLILVILVARWGNNRGKICEMLSCFSSSLDRWCNFFLRYLSATFYGAEEDITCWDPRKWQFRRPSIIRWFVASVFGPFGSVTSAASPGESLLSQTDSCGGGLKLVLMCSPSELTEGLIGSWP